MIDYFKNKTLYISSILVLLIVVTLYFGDAIIKIYRLLKFNGYEPNTFSYPLESKEISMYFAYTLIGVFSIILFLLKKKLGIVLIRAFLVSSILILISKLIFDASIYIGNVIWVELLLIFFLIFKFYILKNITLIKHYYNQDELGFYAKLSYSFIIGLSYISILFVLIQVN